MGRAAKGFWDYKSQRWYARLGEINPKTGKRRTVMLTHEDGSPIAGGTQSERAVAAAISRRLADMEREARRQPAGPTVLGLVTAYLEWHRAGGSAEATTRGHRDQLSLFCRFEAEGRAYGDRPASSIGVRDLARMRQAMEAAGAATGYIRNRYASVLACWRWASRPVEGREPERMIAANPLDGLIRPRRGDSEEKVIPWPLARALLRFMRGICRPRSGLRDRGWPRLWSPGRDRRRWRLNILAVHLAALTGCRPDEAARITWEEVDWKAGAAILRRHKTYGRTGRKRVIAIPGRFLRALEILRDSPGRHPTYVFVPGDSRKVKPPSSHELGRWFRDVRGKAIAAGVSAECDGVRASLPPDLTMYWLRHSFQTEGVQVASVERVAGAVGNSPDVVISTYVHVQARDAHAVAEAVAKARRGRGAGAKGGAGGLSGPDGHGRPSG
jgi:integrase